MQSLPIVTPAVASPSMITPEALHPFKLIRKREKLSINQTASLIGLTRLAIIRTEQALFTSPVVEYWGFLQDITGKSGDELLDAYCNWQYKHRRRSVADIVRAVHYYASRDWEIPTNLLCSPIERFLTTAFGPTSQIGRCKKLCIHPSTLFRYEAANQGYMPAQVMLALEHAGMLPSEIQQLDTLGWLYWNDR